MDLVEAFRAQAGACARLGSPLYGDLLARVADDIATGGPARDVLAGHEDDPGPAAIALRLAGSVHRLVLERRAGALGAWYPSVGGTWEPEGGWAAFRTVLEEQPDDVREWLDRPPQTNEVGRSAALVAGLLHLGRAVGDLPVRLHEIGSSGGLNLLADLYRYDGAGTSLGPAGSPVVLPGAWTTPPPTTGPWPRVVERTGSDPDPIDVRTTQGRLALTAYVWPDQAARLERLRGALLLADRTPPVVRRASAADLVDGLALVDDTLTVLWHSVVWQYLGADEQRHVRGRIDALGAQASKRAPFAHVLLEPTRRSPGADHEFLVVAEHWPTGTREVVATAHPHGLPLTWEGAPRR